MSYTEWIKKNEPTTKDLLVQRSKVFEHTPIISIVVPVYNIPERYMASLLSSVLNQTYPHFELCFADASNNIKVRQLINGFTKKDKRVKVTLLTKNKGIVGNTNEALAMATGEFVCFLDHDDMLAPFALYEIVNTINSFPDVDLIYSDEDFISDIDTDRKNPHFKPDWSPDTIRSYNYVTHLMCIRKSVFDDLGGMREGFDGAQDHDLVLRASEKARRIVHIPKILYHWRQWQGSTAANPNGKSYANESGKKAVKSHLKRLGIKADVVNGKGLFFYKPIYNIDEPPLVSIIIPNMDHIDDLQKCINSIIDKTTYSNYEILIIENNSKETRTHNFYRVLPQKYSKIKVVRYMKPQFNFAEINNFAIDYAKGSILLFLNNDVEIINKEWLLNMVEHAVRPDVGAVGAKLYYLDGRIQHAGIIIGIGGYAAHGHRNFPKGHPGYFGRLNVIQNVSAVTGACLMVRRDVFNEIGGFDERFVLAVNDVDICLRIRKEKYLIVWTPYAELYHNESRTRGYEDTSEKIERFSRELTLFTTKWGKEIAKGDPYYNPNLTLNAENYSLNISATFNLQERMATKAQIKSQPLDISKSRSLKIHVLFSHGFDSKPHFFSDIRLLRPLTHPSLITTTNVTYGVTYKGVNANVVILDRLWKPSLTLAEAKQVVQDLKHSNTCFIYHLDDNIIDTDFYSGNEKKQIAEFFMRHADGIIFSSEGLRERFKDYNKNIYVIPNSLDEKLLSKDRSIGIPDPVQRDIVIGYMGTPTHDNDLKMILPALQTIMTKYDNVYFEVVGALREKNIIASLSRTDIIEITSVRYYPNFWKWMNQNMYWDIGIAPLEDTPFNRAKSDIKFLDYAALGIPGIFSMVKPYQSTVLHNDTGILTINTVDAWTKAFENLIENPDVRHRIARSAYQYLMKNRTLSLNAYKWKEAIEQIYKLYKTSK
jgi:GT2 family glycosyltransferase